MTIAEQPKSKFTGLWKPVTAGERLVHFLADNVHDFRALELSALPQIALIARGPQFGLFLEGCLVLHCFGRLIQVAKYYRDLHLDDPQKAHTEISRFSVELLNISHGSCSDFDQLPVLAFEAAEQSAEAGATPSDRVKNEVRSAFNSVCRCYSCDTLLDTNASQQTLIDGKMTLNPVYLDFEHLWPHSMGGDSIAENLLPSCLPCNGAKQHATSWEWALVQSILPKVSFGLPQLDARHLKRSEKMALHMRAAVQYARTNGSSLKDAYRTVGPRLSNTVVLVDQADTPDFFNLRVHDAALTGIEWE